jgi:hypothetical protein
MGHDGLAIALGQVKDSKKFGGAADLDDTWLNEGDLRYGSCKLHSGAGFLAACNWYAVAPCEVAEVLGVVRRKDWLLAPIATEALHNRFKNEGLHEWNRDWSASQSQKTI